MTVKAINLTRSLSVGNFIDQERKNTAVGMPLNLICYRCGKHRTSASHKRTCKFNNKPME